MAEIDDIERILNSPDFTEGEKWIVKRQYRFPCSSWEQAFYELLKIADYKNLALLEQVFPERAGAFRAWAYGDLGARLRAAGLDL